MNWLTALAAAYDKNSAFAGFASNGEEPLIPLYHGSQNAHIEITLNESGEFQSAAAIGKIPTVIPVTEDSVCCRSSNPCPHPLEDSLKYLSPDVVLKKSRGTQTGQANFDLYIDGLTKWVETLPHPKTVAILAYLKGKTILTDLVRAGVLVETDGKLEAGEALAKTKKDVGGSFVRFSVVTEDPVAACYLDQSLFDCWIEYCRSKNTDFGLCYATGEVCGLSEKHRRFIRNSGDGAKLISANDSSNFTYRGRFTRPGEARGVGDELSQKAHLALKWLISRQSYRCDDLVYVCWPDTKPEKGISIGDDLLGLYDGAAESIDTAQEYGVAITQALGGYRSKVSDRDQIPQMILLGVNSITRGRLSVVYFKELMWDGFTERIRRWYETCSWTLYYWKKPEKDAAEKKAVPYERIGTPTPYQIAEAAYGKALGKSARKFRRKVAELMVHCMMDDAKLPLQVVSSAVNRSAHRPSFASELEWLGCMAIACALYRKYHEKENYQMALEEERTERDYLFGRLLAVLECAEEVAQHEKKVSRMTAAQRFFVQYATFPMTTYHRILDSMNAYWRDLKNPDYFRDKLDAITNLCRPEDWNDKPLSGAYLLGYHTQRQELRKKKDAKPSDAQSAGNESSNENQ